MNQHIDLLDSNFQLTRERPQKKNLPLDESTRWPGPWPRTRVKWCLAIQVNKAAITFMEARLYLQPVRAREQHKSFPRVCLWRRTRSGTQIQGHRVIMFVGLGKNPFITK